MEEPRNAHTLPRPSRLLGRSSQMEALRSLLSTGKAGLISIEGIGGSGKSALVSALLSQVSFDVVHVWPFYIDRDGDAYLADLHARLTGRPLDAGGLGRVDAVVSALKSETRSVMLVLDGLERIQHAEPPHALAEGAMQFFLESMLALPPGCRCVVTTRVPLQFPSFRSASGAIRMSLRGLDRDASMQLLVERGVQGTDRDLAAVADACAGHPLTLNLAAGGIVRFLDGAATRFEPREEFTVRARDAGLPREELQLVRLMAFYRTHLGPQISRLLERVCLFRGPVSFALLERLTHQVAGFLGFEESAALQAGLDLLQSCGLVDVTPDGAYTPHAVVRDYFPTHADGSLHATLVGFLSASPGELRPTDALQANLLEEIIHHTLLGGDTDEAIRLYWRNLGASDNLCESGDLARGERVVRDLLEGTLSRSWRARLYNELAIYLDAQGRLAEAARFYRRALRIRLRDRDAANASRVMQNLCDNALLRGRLPLAAKLARAAMKRALSSSEADDAESARIYGHYIRFLRGYVERHVEDWANLSPAGSGAIVGADALLRSDMPFNALAVARRNLEAVENSSDALAHRVQVQISHALLQIYVHENKRRPDPPVNQDSLTQAIAWARRTGARALLIEALLVQGRILEAVAPGLGRPVLEESLQLSMRHGMQIFEIDARRMLAPDDHETLQQRVENPTFDYRWTPRDGELDPHEPDDPPAELPPPIEPVDSLSPEDKGLLERQLLDRPPLHTRSDMSATVPVIVTRTCRLLLPVDASFAAEFGLLRQASPQILEKMLQAFLVHRRFIHDAAPQRVSTSWHLAAFLLVMGQWKAAERYQRFLPDFLTNDRSADRLLLPLMRGMTCAFTDVDRAARILSEGLSAADSPTPRVAAATAYNLGVLQERCGRPRLARQAFDDCLRWDASFSAALDQLEETDTRIADRARCHASLARVADALEVSRRRRRGEYAASLEVLRAERLCGAPTCPTDGRPYAYLQARGRFLLACRLHRVRRDSTLGDLTPVERLPLRVLSDPFIDDIRRIFNSWRGFDVIIHRPDIHGPETGLT